MYSFAQNFIQTNAAQVKLSSAITQMVSIIIHWRRRGRR